MDIHISPENNGIYASGKLDINCFTEHGLTYTKIDVYPITCSGTTEIDELLLVPISGMVNAWHLMHHLFITFKYITNNKCNIKTIYPIFFKSNDRIEDVLENKYKDLLFTGMGFNYELFKDIYRRFLNKESIRINKLEYVNESINFSKEEPLFQSFKNNILANFNIHSKKRQIDKTVTFIIRSGTRRITNIDRVKERLSRFRINYVSLENLSIKEQLDIVSNSDILIGVHGAGLTWGIFMKERSQMIEIFPGNSNVDDYRRWCKIANIQYRRMPVNISSGRVDDFRSATVNLTDKDIRDITYQIQL
jgi:hypothetical protein